MHKKIEKEIEFKNVLNQLRSILMDLKLQVKNLEVLFRDVPRDQSIHKFSLDGHLIGTIGECLVSLKNPEIQLKKNSTGGFDATYLKSTILEIKTTTIDRVRFVKEYDKVIVVKFNFEKLEVLEDDDWVRFYFIKDGVRLDGKKSKTISISQLKDKEWTGKLD